MKITATIIARNEAHRIARCLESIRWVDEIVIVVDDRTDDGTGEIARRYTERVLVRRFTGYSDQRQWVDDQARGEWILWVDADEVVPDSLRDEIQRERAAPRFASYRVPRLDYMFGKWIRHGGWYPQHILRLYRLGAGRWAGDVHEKVAVKGAIGKLRSPVLHFSHVRVEDWVQKMAHYTSLEAREMHKRGERMGLLRLVSEPVMVGGYLLVLRQGWRDGMHGVALALLMGIYRLMRNLKLWDLTQAARGPREPDTLPPLGG